jgi:hypothetical protein
MWEGGGSPKHWIMEEIFRYEIVHHSYRTMIFSNCDCSHSHFTLTDVNASDNKFNTLLARNDR